MGFLSRKSLNDVTRRSVWQCISETARRIIGKKVAVRPSLKRIGHDGGWSGGPCRCQSQRPNKSERERERCNLVWFDWAVPGKLKHVSTRGT